MSLTLRLDGGLTVAFLINHLQVDAASTCSCWRNEPRSQVEEAPSPCEFRWMGSAHRRHHGWQHSSNEAILLSAPESPPMCGQPQCLEHK
jgi:hypothetical protein